MQLATSGSQQINSVNERFSEGMTTEEASLKGHLVLACLCPSKSLLGLGKQNRAMQTRPLICVPFLVGYVTSPIFSFGLLTTPHGVNHGLCAMTGIESTEGSE